MCGSLLHELVYLGVRASLKDIPNSLKYFIRHIIRTIQYIATVTGKSSFWGRIQNTGRFNLLVKGVVIPVPYNYKTGCFIFEPSCKLGQTIVSNSHGATNINHSFYRCHGPISQRHWRAARARLDASVLITYSVDRTDPLRPNFVDPCFGQ